MAYQGIWIGYAEETLIETIGAECMKNRTIQIDLVKLLLCLLRRAWIIALCGIIGFSVLYARTSSRQTETYTASGTMYVYNGNPNMVNYQYASLSDLSSAVQLLDTYMVVVRSNKVMNAVAERLSASYPGIEASYIASTLSMGSVSETGVLRVNCVTNDAQKSADICNAVMDVAPAEIIRVVSAGGIEIIDYAEVPQVADHKSPLRMSLYGALAGMALAIAILTLMFVLNKRLMDARELTDRYTPPLLSSVRRTKGKSTDPADYLLNAQSPMEIIESYSKLRMNLFYTMANHPSKVVVVTSAISGEGKSTITANLAISCAMSGKRVILIDGDMRRACQREIFKYSHKLPGLSDVLIGAAAWQDCVFRTSWELLHILPAGQIPPNPSELLESARMKALLDELNEQYDLILVDSPPINIASDPLALSDDSAGCLFITRQYFSDHREISKALISAEMTGMNVLGFVFSGDKLPQTSYYNHRYYKNYYQKYDTRLKAGANKPSTDDASGGKAK